MSFTDVLQIVTSFFGTFGFGILFNLRGRKLWLGALGGLLSWTLFLALGFCIESEVLRYFIVSAALSVYSEILARWLKTPTTTFSIISLIPLIPGGSLYYTMAYALHGDLERFLPKALYTLELSAALSAGILFVTAAVRTWKRLRNG